MAARFGRVLLSQTGCERDPPIAGFGIVDMDKYGPVVMASSEVGSRPHFAPRWS
jgi:hypothetical protein